MSAFRCAVVLPPPPSANAPRWSGPSAPESTADPHAEALEVLVQLLEPVALDAPRYLEDESERALDPLLPEHRERLRRLAGAAVRLLEEARRALAVRDTEPGGG